MTFDFPRLRRDLVRASKRAIAEAKRARPREAICAYAIYSDAGAMTACPSLDFVASRDERIAGSPDFAGDMTFATAEWALESVGARVAFENICDRLRAYLEAHPRGFARFRRALFDTCVDALDDLRRARAVPRDALLLFAVSDSAPSVRRDAQYFARLNPDAPRATAARYRAWLRACASLA